MRKSNHGKVTFVDVILLIVFMCIFIAVMFVSIKREGARTVKYNQNKSAYVIETLDDTPSVDSSTVTTLAVTSTTETAAPDETTTSESKAVLAMPAVTSVSTTSTDQSTDQSTDKKTAEKTEETAKKATENSVKSTTSTATTSTTSTESVVVENTAVRGKYYTEQDVIDIAKVLYRECGCLPSKTEQACVAWTILNRVDYYKKSIYEIVRAPYQYTYRANSPVKADLYELAWDVLERWSREKDGEAYVGRVLPRDYMWFWGDGRHNHFRNAYTRPYKVWDYSLGTPYDS